MVEVTPIIIDGYPFIAVSVKLPKTNLLAVASDKRAILCAGARCRLIERKLRDRGIIAGRAVGVHDRTAA
ncbi:hypothetical protein F6Y03_00655 [Bacillus megaterium]|nr:hypothetical protein [Priestia megaterium]